MKLSAIRSDIKKGSQARPAHRRRILCEAARFDTRGFIATSLGVSLCHVLIAAPSCNTSDLLISMSLAFHPQMMLSIHSHPALAADSTLTITQSQLKEAEELYELIRQRTGKDLPKLTSSPNVKASARESIRSSLSPSSSSSSTLNTTSLPPAFSEADAQSIAQLKAELEKINRELQEKSRLAESEKKELLKLEENLEQLRSSSSNTEGGKEEESSGALGFLNVIGILVGGSLAGYVSLQKKEAKGTQEELSSALSKEQLLVNDLKAKAAAVQASLEFEQEIVAKMKKEVSKIQQDSSQLLSAEKREKEAAIKASELANRALEAERNLVKAVRKETTAAQEQAQAERAAKFVAEAEIAAIAKQLKDAQEQIEKERVMARKIGLDASKAIEQVGADSHLSLNMVVPN